MSTYNRVFHHSVTYVEYLLNTELDNLYVSDNLYLICTPLHVSVLLFLQRYRGIMKVRRLQKMIIDMNTHGKI